MRLVVVDNYDSFTYNLVEYFHKLGVKDVAVYRNDAVTLAQLDTYDRIVLSPGPGLPEDIPLLAATIQAYQETKPILGICLGHQAIAKALGGTLVNGQKVCHGIATVAKRTSVNKGCLKDFSSKFQIGHYHSWYVAEADLPECLEVTCYDESGRIMGLVHKKFQVEGIQFHPESVLTPLGLEMLANWVKV